MTLPQHRDSLALRAARYFGSEDQPRTSITVRPGESVLIIRQDGYVCLYSEVNGHEHGEWFRLTPTRLKKITEALGNFDV